MELEPPIASGRSIRSAVEVVEPRFEWTPSGIWRALNPGPLRAEVTDGSRRLASLTSEFVKTREISNVAQVRQTTVELPSGATWTTSTEPDWRATKKDRALTSLIVVRNDVGRVLAVVRSPGDEAARQAKAERKRLLRERGDTASDRLTRTARALSGSVLSDFGRDHRRGLLKWLILGSFLMFLAFGFAIGGLSSVSAVGVGQMAIFLVVAAVLAIVGWRFVRRWRDAGRCWSCGFPTEGRPDACISCSAPRPAGGGVLARLQGFSGEAAASMALTETIPVRLEAGAVTVTSAGGSAWAAQRSGGWVVEETLVVGKKVRGTVTIVPEGEVSLEVALAMWHKSVGDVVHPSSN